MVSCCLRLARKLLVLRWLLRLARKLLALRCRRAFQVCLLALAALANRCLKLHITFRISLLAQRLCQGLCDAPSSCLIDEALLHLVCVQLILCGLRLVVLGREWLRERETASVAGPERRAFRTSTDTRKGVG